MIHDTPDHPRSYHLCFHRNRWTKLGSWLDIVLSAVLFASGYTTDATFLSPRHCTQDRTRSKWTPNSPNRTGRQAHDCTRKIINLPILQSLHYIMACARTLYPISTYDGRMSKNTTASPLPVIFKSFTSLGNSENSRTNLTSFEEDSFKKCHHFTEINECWLHHWIWN